MSKIDNWSKQIKDPELLFNKIQKDLGIPKNQLDLIKDSEGNTIKDKVISFMSNYSYTVEINTATQDVKDAFGGVFVRDYPNKKIGDSIKQDETVLEIATDKVDSEIPAPFEGTLHEILFNEGQVVQVGSVIARISSGGTLTQNVSVPKTEAPVS